MIWTILTCIAAIISMVAYIITALYIRAELKGLEKDRYLTVTSQLFTTWQSREFMEAQLWLLHRLQETTWEGFVAAHRADTGEMAFHQVGAFYDRVGTLIRMNLINDKEILATMGGYAIAVWQKIGPLVLEARQIENSMLFQYYEQMLPACHECYVPSLKMDAKIDAKNEAGMPAVVVPFSLAQPASRITIAELRRRIQSADAPVVLDVRQMKHIMPGGTTLPHAIVIPPDDIATRYRELPQGRKIAVYCA